MIAASIAFVLVLKKAAECFRPHPHAVMLYRGCFLFRCAPEFLPALALAGPRSSPIENNGGVYCTSTFTGNPLVKTFYNSNPSQASDQVRKR